MFDKWSPTSKLSSIKLPGYPDGQYIFFACARTHLSTLSIKISYLQIFTRVYYDSILSIV